MLGLSDRVTGITLSSSLNIAAKAIAMREKGVDVISLSVGEPDFVLPEALKKSAIDAIHAGYTRYTKVDGIAPLKEEISRKLATENGLHYDCAEIIVGAGAKQVIFNVVMALLNPGDEAIIPSPYWVSYPEMVKFASARPVVVEGKEKNDYKISPDLLENAITDRTKLFFLNSPSNPNGSVYTRDELAAIADVLKENNVVVISDEIYEKIIFPPHEHYSIASVAPFLKERTMVVNGFSKAYSIPGLRIGYGAGPKYIIDAIKKIQSHSTSNASSIGQYAVVPAFRECQEFIREMRDTFSKRRDFVFKRLSSLSGFKVRKPSGAFYFFPDISYYFEKGFATDVAFCDFLLTEANVAVVPGSAFGMSSNIRISYAADIDVLDEALKRIERATKGLI